MAGEENAVLRGYAEVEREFPNAQLILAPRKPEQFDIAAEIVRRSGRELVRRREITLNGAGNAALAESRSILLLDSLGELSGIYRLADAVFVGGSLVPNGGHNILEPAAFGKVPVYGPSMENFREIAANFVAADAGIQVRRSEDLGAAWLGLLKNPERSARMGASARNLVNQNRGATSRVMDRIAQVIDTSRSQP